MEYYRDSFPLHDGYGPPRPRDVDAAHDGVEYLQPRIADLFQEKIGVSKGSLAERKIALLGAIKLLNRYQFAEVELPVKGTLELTNRDSPADAVSKAEEHFDELLSKLRQFQAYLRRDGGFFHEAAMKTTRYLTILQPPEAAEINGKE